MSSPALSALHFDDASYVAQLHRTTPRKYDLARLELENLDWPAWRADVRRDLAWLLGLPAIEMASLGLPLDPRLLETVDFPDYTREKWTIAAEPRQVIPFYLLLPKNRGSAPRPLVLCPHGHGRRGKEVYVGNYEGEEDRELGVAGERDIALQALAEGYAVIAPDVRGFWEMARIEEQEQGANNSCFELQRKALLHGRSLLGERVHDMRRLLDYAATRPEIDSSRIAMTGNSGGGTTSMYTAALDERISIVAPGSCFCTFLDSIVAIHHCACNIVPGLLQLVEHAELAALISPRPLLVIQGRTDHIFPIAASEREFTRLHAVYAAQGLPERCELYIGEGGHRYYKARTWDFIRQFWGGDPSK